jgi:hypothetical protein
LSFFASLYGIAQCNPVRCLNIVNLSKDIYGEKENNHKLQNLRTVDLGDDATGANWFGPATTRPRKDKKPCAINALVMPGAKLSSILPSPAPPP